MPPKPTHKPDLADKIVLELSAARTKAIKDNRPFLMEQAAQLVRLILIDGLQPDSKAPSSPFGDRKAIPPTPEQVTAYAASRGAEIDGGQFCDFYISKGWKIGKNPMIDWQAACRTWIRSNCRHNAAKPSTPKDYAHL